MDFERVIERLFGGAGASQFVVATVQPKPNVSRLEVVAAVMRGDQAE